MSKVRVEDPSFSRYRDMLTEVIFDRLSHDSHPSATFAKFPANDNLRRAQNIINGYMGIRGVFLKRLYGRGMMPPGIVIGLSGNCPAVWSDLLVQHAWIWVFAHQVRCAFILFNSLYSFLCR